MDQNKISRSTRQKERKMSKRYKVWVAANRSSVAFWSGFSTTPKGARRMAKRRFGEDLKDLYLWVVDQETGERF